MMAGSTMYPDALDPTGPWRRQIVQRYGGQDAEIAQGYWDMPGYRRELGSASYAPSNAITGSGGARIRSFGGGDSNPGAYNYGTLGNVVNVTGSLLKTAANFAMDRMDGADPDLDFRFGGTPIYNQYRGKQQKVAQIQRIRANQQARAQKQQAAAQQQQTNTFAQSTFATAQTLAAGQVAGKKLVKGASSPLRRGPSSNVNLLTGPTALGQPAKKPRAARSTVAKPKATRPAINLNDPSNW